MDPILLLLVSVAIFWAIIVILNRKYGIKKHGFSLEGGMLIWRTKRGLQFIDQTAKNYRRGWLAFGTVAAIAGIALMIFVFFNFCLNAIIIFAKPELSLPGATFVLPGLVPGLTVYWWLLAIASVMITHEFAHGFLMRSQNIPTKSMGGLFFIAIPGAFVEPDEKKLKTAPISARLRVYGAGSFANILFAFFCLAIILFLLTPKPGVYVWGVRENGPSENFLVPGMRLFSVNGIGLNNWIEYSKIIENVKPGENVTIWSERGFFTVVADNFYSENRGSLGIIPASAVPHSNFANPLFAAAVMVWELTGQRVLSPYLYNSAVPWDVIDALKWMFILNLGIGLFNLLPMLPLDGGYILTSMLEWKTSVKKARKVGIALSLIVFMLLALNFVPYLT